MERNPQLGRLGRPQAKWALPGISTKYLKLDNQTLTRPSKLVLGAEPNQEHVTGPDKIQIEPTEQRNGHSLCLGKFGKVLTRTQSQPAHTGQNLYRNEKRGDKALA